MDLTTIAIENPDACVAKNTLDILCPAGLKVVIAKYRDDRDLHAGGQLICQYLGFFRQSIVGEVSTKQKDVGPLINLLEQRF
jgi:hypothetical protein